MTDISQQPTPSSPNYDRWLLPPAALAVHLCIGMAYGFSVFWLPLTRAIGIDAPVVCEGMGLGQALTTTVCDWRVSDLIWIYTLYFAVLGAAAALFGGWLERVGPRRAALVAAACWCGGMLIAAVGVAVHQLWLLWLGAGVIGGVGLGIGYISPVSMLIKWFPEWRGMATGMAIMGFGGGAMIGGPLANALMQFYAGPASVGVWQTLVTMAGIYAMFMLAGALGYRTPPAARHHPASTKGTERGAGPGHELPLERVHRTPQFWLLWVVLFLNTSAGIGLIGLASPLLQEIMGGRLFGEPGVEFADFTAAQQVRAASVGAGFVGLLSLFNIGGRFFWASLSDRLGRRVTYFLFFSLGASAFALAPALARLDTMVGFLAAMCLIATMYGGGFSTIPAYLADIFGTRFVGAIHGRLLTAWSAAGIVGPLLVAYCLDIGRGNGLEAIALYAPVYWLLAGLLAAGFIANMMVRPIGGNLPAPQREAAAIADEGVVAVAVHRSVPKLVFAWAAVLLPLAWGVAMTLKTAAALFF